jgi:hypothetical protein
MAYSRFIIVTAGALLLGCAGSPPGTPGPAAQMPRQNCAACMEENPGDVVVCSRICHEQPGDSAGPNAGSVLR